MHPSQHAWAYLFFVLELLRIKTVEQQGQEEVEDHEVAHDQSRQEDEEAGLCTRHFFGTHAVPQRFYPLSAEYSENHHEWMEEIIKVPSGKVNSNGVIFIVFSNNYILKINACNY